MTVGTKTFWRWGWVDGRVGGGWGGVPALRLNAACIMCPHPSDCSRQPHPLQYPCLIQLHKRLAESFLMSVFKRQRENLWFYWLGCAHNKQDKPKRFVLKGCFSHENHFDIKKNINSKQWLDRGSARTSKHMDVLHPPLQCSAHRRNQLRLDVCSCCSFCARVWRISCPCIM